MCASKFQITEQSWKHNKYIDPIHGTLMTQKAQLFHVNYSHHIYVNS